MNVGAFFESINRFDLLVILFLIGMFVLGFWQGTIRRLLGLASMLFSFLFACVVRDSLGAFLASNWNQFPDEYAIMIGFLVTFLAATLAFTLVIQGFYKHQPLLPQYSIVDELLGALLGVLQGVLFIGFIIVILDSYFVLPVGVQATTGEIPILRTIFEFYDPSTTAGIYRATLIPIFFGIFGLFIPNSLKAIFTPGS